MQNPKTRRIVRAVVILTVAVLAWLLWSPRATGPSTTSDAANPRTRRTVRTTEIPWEDPAANLPERRKESLVPMQKSRLDSFFIPAVSANKVTVTEALERLEKAFGDACRESREELPPLTLEVRDDPGARLTFSFAGTTFSSDLRHLAALAGMEVMQKGNPRNAFVLVTARSEAEPAEVRIDDPVLFARGFRELGGIVARPEFTPPSFRASSEPEETPPTLAEWREILRQSGLCQDSGYACRQAEHGVQITVTASPADLRRITSAKTLLAESRAQLKVMTRILASEQSLQAPAEVLDEPQMQSFMREMARKKGTDLMTIPSVTALHNQPVDLQVIKERETDGRTDWTGVKFSLVARFVGWKIAGNPRMEIRADEKVGFSAQGRKNVLLKSGETAVVPLVSPEKALVVSLVTFQRIDATGRDLNGPREPEAESLPTLLPPLAEGGPNPVAKAVPGSPGMVFSPHSNKIVDVRDIPPGTLVADPQFPPEEKKYFRVP